MLSVHMQEVLICSLILLRMHCITCYNPRSLDIPTVIAIRNNQIVAVINVKDCNSATSVFKDLTINQVYASCHGLTSSVASTQHLFVTK